MSAFLRIGTASAPIDLCNGSPKWATSGEARNAQSRRGPWSRRNEVLWADPPHEHLGGGWLPGSLAEGRDAHQQRALRCSHLGQGFIASAQNPSSISTTRTPEKPAAVSRSATPLFSCPECRVKASAILPPGFMTRRISRNPATASGQTCMELTASAPSNVLSANGNRALPQFDPTSLDRFRVSRRSLLDHLLGGVDAHHTPRRRRRGE